MKPSIIAPGEGVRSACTFMYNLFYKKGGGKHRNDKPNVSKINETKQYYARGGGQKCMQIYVQFILQDFSKVCNKVPVNCCKFLSAQNVIASVQHNKFVSRKHALTSFHLKMNK